MAPKHKPITHWRQLVRGALMEEVGPGAHRMMIESAICAHIDGCEPCVTTAVERIAADTGAMITMRRYVAVLATGTIVEFDSEDEAADIETGSVAVRQETVKTVIVATADMFSHAHAHHSGAAEHVGKRNRVTRPGQRRRGNGGPVH